MTQLIFNIWNMYWLLLTGETGLSLCTVRVYIGEYDGWVCGYSAVCVSIRTGLDGGMER